MNIQNLPKHIARFDPNSIVTFLLSVSIFDVFLFTSLGVASVLANFGGWYSHHLFKRKRRRAFMLDKMKATGYKTEGLKA